MHYKLYKILSDIAELLMLFASKRIDKEQLHNYIIQDVDFFIELNRCFYDCEFTPSPVAMSGKRKEKNVSTRQNCRN